MGSVLLREPFVALISAPPEPSKTGGVAALSSASTVKGVSATIEIATTDICRRDFMVFSASDHTAHGALASWRRAMRSL